MTSTNYVSHALSNRTILFESYVKVFNTVYVSLDDNYALFDISMLTQCSEENYKRQQLALTETW